MPRYDRFSFTCDEKERQAIKALAERLQRHNLTPCGLVVREAAQQFADKTKATRAEPEPAQAAQP